MSVEAVLARISELDKALAPRPPAAATRTSATPPVSFAAQLAAGLGSGAPGPMALGAGTADLGTLLAGLRGAGAAGPLAGLQAAVAPGPAGSTAAGMMALRAAQGEVGQAEQPPGSNDSPRIAQYRTSTAGSGIGPWCAYFTSWAAAQAGAPLGEAGQGFGSVDALYAWAQRTGHAVPAPASPAPGDLIVWDEHIGIVESVAPDGKITTIEGNSSNAVTRRTHDAGGDGAVGYVKLG